MKHRRTVSYCCLLLILFIFNRCANPVTPEGGHKDVKPPEIVNCDPPKFTTNFNSKEIKIEFDEFIQLKDAGNQIIISPPLLPNTEFRLRGKSIIIELGDDLLPNTTYAINFGEAVSDITENNLLQNFIYVFSTGSFVDSLSLEGKVIDAYDLSSQKNTDVMLYIDNNDTIPFDSLPYLMEPYYLTRTDENGEFRLANLSDLPFKIFALKDINGDFLYNLPDEKIAFYDSMVKGNYIAPVIPDTVKKDSLSPADSLKLRPENKSFIILKLFQQYDSVQRILKSKLIQDGQVGFYFRYPTKQPRFMPLNFIPSSDWKIEEINRHMDTIYLWMKQLPGDSLVVQVDDNGKILDTVEVNLVKKREKTKKEKEEGTRPKRLSVTTNTVGGSLNQFGYDLVLSCSYPLSRYNLSSLSLVDAKDTVKPKAVLVDSLKRSIRILYKWKEDKKYILIIPDSVFFSINDLTNDSLIFGFRTRSAKDFGSLRISINAPAKEGQYIIQLLSDKDVLIEERILNGSGKIDFKFLSAHKFKLKAIWDQNRNGHWDTGDYLKKIQPEKVWFFPKVIEIRANWEVEDTWDL